MQYSRSASRTASRPTPNASFPSAYNRWFEAVPANTPELREKAYRLRYQVYCCENPFESPEEHPHHMETDPFDQRSLHSLIISRESGTATGTVRLILPDAGTPKASLPIQMICEHPMIRQLPPAGAAEISRFAISKKIRRMAEQTIELVSSTGERIPAATAKAMKCSLTLLLMREIVRMSRTHGVSDWYAVMEPALLRLLARFGIHFNPLGPQVEYHGLRQPCHAKAEELLGRMRREKPEIWSFITDQAL